MKKLDKIYRKSRKIIIDDKSKIVIMSDCHRGSGNINDNFIKNKDIYLKALNYYYNNEYSYIELGDGDEMWEVINYNKLIDKNIDVYRLLKKFHDEKRLIMIYGNHDIAKKHLKVLKKYFYKYQNKLTEEEEYLLYNMLVYESLILEYHHNSIFLVHGHQVDFLNGTIIGVSRFLVRYIWAFLEKCGFEAPTELAKNYKVKKIVEKKLSEWSIKRKKILIAGHTHRPIYPIDNTSLYFNDGSCLYNDGITCIEISNGMISLVKWVYELKNNNISYTRKVIMGNKLISDFFNN